MSRFLRLLENCLPKDIVVTFAEFGVDSFLRKEQWASEIVSPHFEVAVRADIPRSILVLPRMSKPNGDAKVATARAFERIQRAGLCGTNKCKPLLNVLHWFRGSGNFRIESTSFSSASAAPGPFPADNPLAAYSV